MNRRLFLRLDLERLTGRARILISIFLLPVLGALYFYFYLAWKYNLKTRFLGISFNLWPICFSLLILAYFLIGAHLIRKYRDTYIKRRIAFLVIYQFVCFYLMGYIFFNFYVGALFMPWPANFMVFKAPLKIVVYYHALFAFVVIPFLIYFFGRGAVCSWFCNYGVHPELFGDCFRDRAPKNDLSIKLELIRYIPFSFVIIVTVLPLINIDPRIYNFKLSEWYAFLVMGLFGSIIGQSVFPLLGGRIYCRYICPLGTCVRALARFTRFKIMTFREKCNRCGLCTKYCQMGIDCMRYVIEGRQIATGRCVGCGICVEKCPAGALKLSFIASRRSLGQKQNKSK